MQIETVTVTAKPMLYVSRVCAMDPQSVSAAMGEAFQAIGAFLGQAGIAPAGPPLAIYRSWEGGSMAFDVGFPVAAADLARADGEVKAGQTPSGPAARLVHVGPYDTLAEGYGALQAYLAAKGLSQPALTWDVYVDDPDRTPPAQRRTELYMSLSATPSSPVKH